MINDDSDISINPYVEEKVYEYAVLRFRRSRADFESKRSSSEGRGRHRRKNRKWKKRIDQKEKK